MTRRSLLASLMALSLLCGGLGVASASLEVVDQSGTAGTVTIYTKDEVDNALTAKGSATDVASNTTDITNLKNAVGDAGSGLTKEVADQKAAITANTTSIDTNKAAIESLRDDKLDKALANSTFATKDALDDLTTTVNGKADKTYVDTELANKADKADVYSKTGADDKFATKDALNNKADKNYVDTAVAGAVTTAGTNVEAKLADYAKTADVDTKLAGKADKATTLAGYGITNAYTKDEVYNRQEVARKLDKKADQAALTQATDRITVNENAIAGLTTKTTDQQTAIDDLKKKTTQISYADGDGTRISGVTIKDGNIVGNGNSAITQLANVGTDKINGKSLAGTTVATEKEVANAVKAETDARTAADNVLSDRITANANTIASVNQELVNTNNHFNTELGKTNAALHAEEQIRANADAALANDIKATNDRTGGIERNTEKTQTTIEGSVKVDNKGNVKDVKGLSAETITTSGNADLKGNVILGTNTANTVTVNGNADFNEAVNMDKGLTVTSGDTTLKGTKVDGKLIVTDEADLKNTKVDGTLGVTGATMLSGELTAEKNATFKEDVTVKGTTNLKGTTVDGDLKVTGTITTDKMVFGDPATNNYTEIDHGKVTSKNLVVNGAGQTISSSSTFDVEKNEVGFTNTATGDHSYYKQTAKGINGNVTDKDGNKTDMNVTATENSIQIQDKDGKNTNLQVNKMDSSVTEIKNGDGKTTKTEQTATDITNTAKDGTITNDANHIENTANTMNTTVTGKATESYGELDTTVNGKETHKVTGDQENTIGGNQTTTVEGNVKEDYKKDLTTTVGGNELHEVTGTKTENVTGKVTENYGNGQETNVTGDQDIKVSGTQTTTATDINRNASSGMIDTVENAFGSNTETKVAGQTTTDVKLASGEEGHYIRGATESRDYLLNGALKNSETKTAEATSSEITDGTNTASTRQDAKNLAGSVTNGTETGVSGIHANDNGSVSIDSAVIDVNDGNKYSVINQKKGSIQSTVVDGTNSTVILQDKDNVTIASSNGMVGIVGKDIVNNAQDTITNTAGTKITDKVGTNTRVIDSTSITDTVGATTNRKIEDGKITDTAGDSTVTTENGKGTTFAKTDSAEYSTEAGAPKDTNIAGNLITTGRVDANELGVSDKDGANSADLSVKAGEGKGVKASAGNGITTGSLDVKADKVTTSIKSGSKENTVISTADGTSFSNSKANTAFEGGTYTDTTIKGNTITTGKVTMDYAEVMKDLGVNRNANIGGKTTTGSLEVKGESKLTGNVTMENNATVGNDLIVKGITTTKTLKVTENAEIDGTLKVAKKATFEDSVSIAKDLSVGGDVTAKSYKVGDKTYIDANGIHANDQKITNVADGSISEGSKDAVNGGQLYGVKRDLEHQVDKVGANAAAMANLRPMEFDPSSKWNIAAAIGNYGSETAAALGAFYRPNDDVMVNLSTAFGTGENMVGGGVSVRLGKGGNKLSREETNALKAQVDDLTARMDALLSVLNPNMSKDFPDVPENHWAYEAVSRLAGNDIVQGYPDGEFHGERTMTRYEMAEIIYNALSRGAEAERELVEEFKPELQAMAASEKATAEKAEG